VVLCARCGDDDLGHVTVASLKRNGNADGVHIAKGFASAYTLALAPPGIDRIFIHNPGTNDTFGPEDLDPELIAQCNLFHFGYPPLMRRMYQSEGEELRQVLKTAKDAGATVSLDMSLPDPDSDSGKVSWRDILAKILPYVDIFVPSIEECFFMLHREEFLEMKRAAQDAELVDLISPARYGEIADECLALGTKMVNLKAAHRGFFFRTAAKERFEEMGAARPGDPENWGNRELWAEAFVVEKMASATGSGDSAIAGLLTGFLRGLSIERALRCATVVGLQNLRALDAVSGIRPWEETAPMLDLEMPTLNPHLDGTDWKFSKEHRLWLGPRDRLR
jgi:sugar/nucleoside kinase (ribokinase family)